MLNPSDNRSLNCFVKESRIDNDFKLTMYPRWTEIQYTLTKEICKTKELYYKMCIDPRIKAKIDDSPLELIKLHHDMSELTDKWTNEFQKISNDYAETLMRKIHEFAESLDQTGITGLKIDRCFKPYVKEAENKRRSIFESFQKNLVDGLLWEHTTRDNRRVEQGQPSVGNSTGEVQREGREPQDAQPLDWSNYADMKFASRPSAISERAEAGAVEDEEAVEVSEVVDDVD